MKDMLVEKIKQTAVQEKKYQKALKICSTDLCSIQVSLGKKIVEFKDNLDCSYTKSGVIKNIKQIEDMNYNIEKMHRQIEIIKLKLQNKLELLKEERLDYEEKLANLVE